MSPGHLYMSGSVRRIACLLAGVIGMGCSSTGSPDAYLSVTTARRAYTVTLDIEGELEAKVAHTLVTPQVRAQPTVATLIKEGASVKKGDVVVVFEVDQLVIDHRNALDEVEIARAEARQTEANMKLQRLMLESEMHRMEAAVATARLQLPRLEFAAPRMRKIEELEMKKSELEAAKIQRKLASLDGIEKEELEHLRLKISQAETKLRHTRMFLDKLTLIAPVNGMVMRTTNWATGDKIQEGDTVWGGMPVVKIPDMSVMQVKALVGETDAQRLKTGQRVTITVPSADNLQVPGAVASIARVAKPVKRNSRVKKVDVIVAIDSTHVAMVPGLTAVCRIVIEEIPDALVVPLECVFDQDSLKVVYTRDGGVFVQHKVTVAQQGNDFAIITDGIGEGEILALRKPGAALITD